MRVLFLDVDGVLNRTAFRPAESVGLRSWIEPDLAHRLDTVVAQVGAVLVMSSDWRCGRSLPLLRAELRAAGITSRLLDVTPVLGGERWREIDAWLTTRRVPLADAVIIDDTHDMGPLSSRFVRTTALAGLDDAAARALLAMFAT